mmetsp:Transcript_12297/g.21001  ORF Transcript_12297/g.21001 Transcript_12297/m.21001 type:complete len:387 (+) Transcript_12297:3-1163(+)
MAGGYVPVAPASPRSKKPAHVLDDSTEYDDEIQVDHREENIRDGDSTTPQHGISISDVAALEESGSSSWLSLLPSLGLLFCTVAIIGSLMLYAVLQERIMTRPYGNDAQGNNGEYFENSLFLVLNNRFAAALVAAAILIGKRDIEQLKNVAPLHKYFMISVSNVLATTCQYEALKYVTFPTQTLFKCGKMVPVMIWGTLISRKKYGIIDYMIAVIVAIGCTIFTTSGNIASSRGSPNSSLVGLVLMAGYLGFDGFTSTFQEKLFGSYEMSMYNQMMYVNLCSGLMSLVMLLISGKFVQTLQFASKYPKIVGDATTLSFSAVSGQFAISYTIKNYGALVYATIMTVRQLLSVITSNILFGHNITMLQWISTVAVFGALLFRSWYNKK